MKKLSIVSITTAIAITALSGCNSSSGTEAQKSLSSQTRALGIQTVPTELAKTYSSKLKFNRYTKVTAPNGKAIHIIAQDKLSDNQIVRARSILEHYLEPYPGSLYGADKSAVANKMTENKATLLLLNGSDDGTNTASELNGQPLYQNEIQVEGHSWYVKQNFDHRDASFEEILHMVHDTGIGVDQGGSEGALTTTYQTEIRNAQVVALSNKLWGIGGDAWITELSAENSLSQEYLAAVIDSYYGLWGSWGGSPTHGMWGLYIAKNRAEITSEDPEGASLMGKFFHPYLTYNARIDQSFTGDFSLKFDSSKSYTHHSQYLVKVTLTGTQPSNIVVNGFDNHITGNSANNKVIFSGNSSQYRVTNLSNGDVTVEDLVDNRDGTNRLINIEQAAFTDTVMDL